MQRRQGNLEIFFKSPYGFTSFHFWFKISHARPEANLNGERTLGRIKLTKVKMAALTCAQILLAIGMLISGSINTLSKKAQNDCS